MTPGPEDEVSQAEKRRIIREQATMHAHAVAEAAMMETGRFAAVNATIVTGATPIPKYPAASASWQIQLPDEPPLSAYENPALEDPADVSPVSPSAATDDPAPAPSGGDAASSGDLDVERAGSSSSQLGDPDGVVSQPCLTVHDERAGPPSNQDDDNG
jgi:hypothetical protein